MQKVEDVLKYYIFFQIMKMSFFLQINSIHENMYIVYKLYVFEIDDRNACNVVLWWFELVWN